MHYDYSWLWWSLPGFLIVGHGVIGIRRRNITIGGRGTTRNFQGIAAVRAGVFQIVFGLIFIAFSLLCLIESAYA